ncbi:MAG: hypothetical protein AAB518_00740, partial [Patescibacteria group bacterium]
DDSKVKNELTAEGVLLEGYGGNVSVQGVSGKTGAGISELLDTILLTAELSELTCDLSKPGEGVILEAKIDGRRGIVATGIVKDGTLRVGDKLVSGAAAGKVKGLENFLGERIREAIPSSPVRISGFEELPVIGEKFLVGGTSSGAVKGKNSAAKAAVAGGPEEGTTLVLILKADVAGSLETLSQIITNLPKPDEVKVKIVFEAVGEITDGDVQLAISVGGIIIGFRVTQTKAAAQLAEVHGIPIVTSEIVYELVKTVEDRFKVLDRAKAKGEMEILALFGKKGATDQVIGGKVILGGIPANAVLEVVRRNVPIGSGKILNLQSGRKDVKELPAGNEGGLLFSSETQIRVGDHLILR